MEYAKPLPALDNWNRPFWEGAKNDILTMPCCADCGHTHFPPGPVCPKCLGSDFDWKPLSGKGTVKSWVVFHQLYYKGFADELPYNVTMVELDEGPHLFTNLVGVDNAAIKSGMKVEVVFEQATDDITIPKFRTVAA